MVSWRTFNVHGTIPFYKRLFIVEKDSLDFFEWSLVCTKKNCALKVLWETPNGSSMASLETIISVTGEFS